MFNTNKYGIYFNINNKDYGIFLYGNQLLLIFFILLLAILFIKNKNLYVYRYFFYGAISYLVITNNFSIKI